MDKTGILSHIELYVFDLTRSAKFWGWLLEELGYRQYQAWDNGISYKRGDTYIVFVQVDGKYRDIPHHRTGIGLNHIAFSVESCEQLDHIMRELKARNVPLLYAEKDVIAEANDKDMIYFEDPDSTKVELVCTHQKE